MLHNIEIPATSKIKNYLIKVGDTKCFFLVMSGKLSGNLFISDSLLIVRPGDSIKLLHFEQRWRQH